MLVIPIICCCLQVWSFDKMIQLLVLTHWQGTINFNMKQYWTCCGNHSLQYHNNKIMARRKIYDLTCKTKSDLNLPHYHRHLTRAKPEALSTSQKKPSLVREGHGLKCYQDQVYDLVLRAPSSSYPQWQSSISIKYLSEQQNPLSPFQGVCPVTPSLSCSFQLQQSYSSLAHAAYTVEQNISASVSIQAGVVQCSQTSSDTWVVLPFPLPST